MRSYISITPSRMRSINQTAVLEYVRVNRVVSRSELSEALGLSLPSVVRIVDELIEKKLIRFSGQFEKSGGRRRPLIEFDMASNIAVSVEVGDRIINGAIIDLEGNVLERRVTPCPTVDPDTILDTLLRTVAALHTIAQASDKNYLGIAVEVPCVAETSTGKILSSEPSLFWDHLPLGDILREKFKVPNIVENDSNAAALGEMWYGNHQGIYNLALIQLRKGLGVGLIVDGSIYRGANNAAGELGHLVFSPDNFRRTHDGGYGPVERTIAGIGLIEKARQKLTALGDPGAETVTYSRIFDDYQNGLEWPKQIVQELIDMLSMVIVTVHGMMDCEKTILAGEVIEHAGFLVDEIRSRIYSNIVVEESTIGVGASLLGGIVALIQREMDYCVLKSVL